ncbi:MAG: iron-sulfur cluster loop [Planctomyces sp.]|nr:iron-sulfur cluster loop [Planctomyces sp.]
MSELEIRDALLQRGERLFSAPPALVIFAKHVEADKLLNALDRLPHAFVIGCIMDQQIQAEQAWMIPFRVSELLGSFSIERLAELSHEDIRRLMAGPPRLHFYFDRMSDFFYSAIGRIMEVYSGDASRIWSERPSSAEVVYRFLEFDGVGPKLATMGANILARDFKIPMSDYTSIDISVDRHVRRVFGRLRLCPQDADVLRIIYKARALNPEFPGLLDYPAFELGRELCKERRPLCADCYMRPYCPSAAEYGAVNP